MLAHAESEQRAERWPALPVLVFHPVLITICTTVRQMAQCLTKCGVSNTNLPGSKSAGHNSPPPPQKKTAAGVATPIRTSSSVTDPETSPAHPFTSTATRNSVSSTAFRFSVRRFRSTAVLCELFRFQGTFYFRSRSKSIVQTIRWALLPKRRELLLISCRNHVLKVIYSNYTTDSDYNQKPENIHINVIIIKIMMRRKEEDSDQDMIKTMMMMIKTIIIMLITMTMMMIKMIIISW